MSKTFGVTGGAGFIGINFCDRLLSSGQNVVILDNLSRPGAQKNLHWLAEKYSDGMKFIEADISSNHESLGKFSEKCDVIFHLAGQVAVTTSLVDPYRDFQVNALGTVNLLEAVRHSSNQPSFVFVSTNKVYGDLQDIKIQETEDAYQFIDLPNGVAETRALDFHSPYGCSKGSADQYVLDYSRSFGLSAMVLRQSCIYGPRQFGIEDQGWVAWFIIAAVTGRPITLYGNGKQVRDILYIADLIDLFEVIAGNVNEYSGEVLNVGGGSEQTVSLLQFLKLLEIILDQEIPIQFGETRMGDQPVYISDIRKAEALTGWQPKTSVEEGIRELVSWVVNNRAIFNS
ncbi:MAG: CDP-paratose 2-epimerase [Alphaproteobacteria bacterium MarineAlpha11_Bin1]|nr:MAG: CDP-paratose 2-epimerase [Alphaproteobacteria bacterium MarineAlpha11_Bin1]|tara:strand:- start:3220 stop:4248 length:1029 start_codon:yes stop_codon:yes gene_type:complete